MPRGSKDGNGAPTIGNNGINASPDEISKLTRAALGVFLADTPDLHNPEEVEKAIIGYFQRCDANGVRPGNLGLYAALGMSRQDYHNAITGKSKAKLSPACIDIVKKATIAIGTFREALALEGKLNPVTYIFMGKNYDHLEDQTRLEVTHDTNDTIQLSQEELRKRIPVYSDVENDT